MTIVALPLFKLELSFQVRRGRRWTALEHLLLWAAAQEARSLADLRQGTDMPPRLVVEALVNLLRVGWIEITTLGRGDGNAVLFTANRRGRTVLAEEELPYAYNLERRFASLYVERMTAHVLNEDQMRIRHHDQIDRSTLILRPDHEKYDASPSRFLENLRLRPEDNFERQLGHRVISVAQYAILDVVGEHVGGLPDNVPAQLTEVILRQMPDSHWNGKAEPRTSQTQAARPLTASAGFEAAAFSPGDLLIGGRDHRDELKRMLGEAESIVYIHSTFLGPVIEMFIPDLLAAAAREVEVVLLWGERRDNEREEPNQSEIKGRLAYQKIPQEAREWIRMAPDPTGSHAKILLADSGPNAAFEAVVGSCNWLSANYAAMEISLRLREPRLVQAVAGILADMSRPPSGAWGRDVTTLLKVHDRCRLMALVQPREASAPEAKAMLVVDDEHYAAVRDVRNASAREVIVGCDLFGPAGQTTVLEPLGAAAREDETKVTVLYNRPTTTFRESLDGVAAGFAGPPSEVTQCSGLHGKFLAWNDSTLVITSFNWLAASIGPGRLSVGELGVLIRDPVLVPQFVGRIRSATGLSQSVQPDTEHAASKPRSELA